MRNQCLWCQLCIYIHIYIYIIIYISHLPYTFIYRRTLTLFPYLGDCEYWHNEHANAGVSSNSWFNFFWLYTQEGIARSYGSFIFNVLSNLYTLFQYWLYQFAFPSAMHNSFLFSTSPPILVISCLFVDSHSNRCEVISHFGLNLLFPDD